MVDFATENAIGTCIALLEPCRGPASCRIFVPGGVRGSLQPAGIPMIRAIAFLAAFAPAIVLASDQLGARHAAASRYFSVVPVSEVLEQTYAEIARQLPPEQRPGFIARMRSVVRVDRLERISRDVMIRTFTAGEMNALADFYGSAHGASALRKFGPYMETAMPLLRQEVRRAMLDSRAAQK
jgi:hypothetical protein